MAQTELVIKLPRSQTTRFQRDRHVCHQAIMSMLPSKLGEDPRATSQTLWRVGADRDELIVRSSVTLATARIGRVAQVSERPQFEVGSHLKVSVDVSCLKTPKSDVPEELRPVLKRAGGAYRSHTVIVPESERSEWATGRLNRIGLEAHAVEVSPLMTASLGSRGGRIPYVTVAAEVAVVDAALFEEALVRGIGKGRSFGLGLIQTFPLENGRSNA